MKRRNFLTSGAAAAGAAALPGCNARSPYDSAAPKQKKPIRMHAGTQYIKRHGIDHIACWPEEVNDDTMADDFSRARELVEKHGLHLDVVAPPLLHRAPVAAIMLGKDPDRVVIRLVSGEQRLVRADCRATVGSVSNPDHQNAKLGKAGRSRWLGRRPHVRGVVMNPVDHPHGGGEGRTSGGRHPVTPWGISTKGHRTRSNKSTDRWIIRRRRKK